MKAALHPTPSAPFSDFLTNTDIIDTYCVCRVRSRGFVQPATRFPLCNSINRYSYTDAQGYITAARADGAPYVRARLPDDTHTSAALFASGLEHDSFDRKAANTRRHVHAATRAASLSVVLECSSETPCQPRLNSRNRVTDDRGCAIRQIWDCVRASGASDS